MESPISEQEGKSTLIETRNNERAEGGNSHRVCSCSLAGPNFLGLRNNCKDHPTNPADHSTNCAPVYMRSGNPAQVPFTASRAARLSTPAPRRRVGFDRVRL